MANSDHAPTAHVDTFARDNLPPRASWPVMRRDVAGLDYPGTLNCAAALLDDALNRFGSRVAIATPGGVRWSYTELCERANRIARVLVEDGHTTFDNGVLSADKIVAHHNRTLKGGFAEVRKAAAVELQPTTIERIFQEQR